MNKTAVFTIVSKNYLHFARTLMNSVRQFHPEWEQHVLLVDELKGDIDPKNEKFNVKTVTELNLPNIKQFLFRYNILELNTAVKPWMFEWLFKQDKYDKLIYIDPDIRLYDTMDEVIDELDKGRLMVITPHLTAMLDDGKKPSELEILRSGTYNLGFLAVSKHKDTLKFFKWWQSKLEFDCVVDFPNGLFVDQKWIDLVPGFFSDIKILHHPGYNVAYWNLLHRKVEEVDGNYKVNGERLVFFHYSGLNPSKIENFSKHQDRFRYSNLNEAARILVKNYANEVLNSGFKECSGWNYSFSIFSNGTVISDLIRIAYRNDEQLQQKCGENPFEAGHVFLTQQVRRTDGDLPLITKLMHIIWTSRPDLQQAFPDIWHGDRASFCQWFIDSAEREYSLTKDYIEPVINSLKIHRVDKVEITKAKCGPKVKYVVLRGAYVVGLKFKPVLSRVVPDSFKPAFRKLKDRMIKATYPSNQVNASPVAAASENNYPTGLNLIGYARAEMGIGESCRIAAKAINTTDIPFGIIDFTVGNSARMMDSSWAHKEVNDPIYNTNLMVINADQTPLAYTHLGHNFFAGRYNIGYWAWELPDFPDEWCDSFNLVQEVWVPSNFVVDSVSKKSRVPVIRIPHAIEVNCPVNVNRRSFNLPENQFLFLSMYDTHSFQARKNPQGAIKSFQMAFDKEDTSVGLVLKVNNAKSYPAEVERLKEYIDGYKNIYLIEEILTRDNVNALINSVDCFVSLHRSEGFGLILAEAMYLGKPVIGTGWSGNIDFMNNMNSCPVNYEMVKVGEDHGPYKAYQVWAEPDIEHAAYYMKMLISDQHWSKKLGDKAMQTIRNEFSPEVVGKAINQRLQILGLI